MTPYMVCISDGSEIIVPLTTVLAVDSSMAANEAIKLVPEEYLDNLSSLIVYGSAMHHLLATCKPIKHTYNKISEREWYLE